MDDMEDYLFGLLENVVYLCSIHFAGQLQKDKKAFV